MKRTTLILISPEQAALLLKHSKPKTRPLDQEKIGRLMQAMGSDEFRPMDGAPVTLVNNGQIRNGWHRLSAVARLGKPVRLNIRLLLLV